MAKSLASVGLAVFFASLGLAQHHGSGGMQSAAPQPAARPQPLVVPQTLVSPRSSTPGFGSAVFPGGVTAPGRVVFPGAGQFPVGTITDPTFASRLGATVSGLNDGRRFRRFREPLLVPYAYPVYLGDYSQGYQGYGQDQPNITIVNPPQQSPQVIINQNFLPDRATPVIRDYTDDSSGVHIYEAPSRNPADNVADEGTDYYLIAFKDHSIYSAFAYWVEGDTLHYVTPQRVHNQASVTLVDRELTEKLNRERNLQVKLPR
jgi:hypothetical protein